MEIVKFAKKKPLWLIFGVALILRLINLNQSLWLDEATQAILSSKSFYSIIYERAADFHPPFSYMIYHFWLMFGRSEIWMRLLPVIFGVATIFVTYLLAKEIFNKKTGIISALFLAIAPYHIYYSQELRMYSMAAFFAALSMYFLQKLLREKKEETFFSQQIGFIMATTLLIYTHYLGFFVIISQFIYVTIISRKKIKTVLSNYIITGLLYLPWIPFFLVQLQSGVNVDQYLPGWRNALSLSFPKAVPLTLFKFSFGRIDFDNNIIYILIALPVLGVVLYLLSKPLRQYKERNTSLVTFWFMVPLFLALVISIKIPLNQPFRLLPILSAFYILLAVGILSLKKFRNLFIGLLILISISGLSLYYINPKYQRENWKGAVQFIDRSSIGNKVIFAWPQPFDPYIWYQGKDGIGVVKSFPAKQDDVYQNMNQIDTNEVFVFEYLQSLSDPDKHIQRWLLENGYQLKDTINFEGVGFLRYYAKGELNV